MTLLCITCEDFRMNKTGLIFMLKKKWQMKKKPIDSPFLGKHLDADTKESVALFKLVSESGSLHFLAKTESDDLKYLVFVIYEKKLPSNKKYFRL